MPPPVPKRPSGWPLSLDQLGGQPPGARGPQPVQRPQRPLQQAAAAQRPQAAPAGLGLDSDSVRRRMVERLRQGGLRHDAVLQAMGTVPRHRFVDTALATQAYEDTSLPIGGGQTISKPSVVGRMIELLMAGDAARAQGSLGRVLEIGSGCGYQAAVLAQVSRQVISIERLGDLHRKARETLSALRELRVRLIHADGRLGHPPSAPYDSIIAAAGGESLPAPWLDQLAVGGRLVAPMADARTGQQVLVSVDRTPDGLVHRVHETVLFVPLKSGLL